MENIITQFNFQSTHQVRIVINNDGEPLFCLKDICNILEIQNHKDLLAKQLDKQGVEKIYLPTQSGHQHITFINEPNLYRVIFRSNKKEARAFQDWVFNEVLPSIRKTGTYTVPSNKPTNELTDKDWSNLKRLVWLCENNFRMKGSASHAIWARLRTVTGVKSPEKFSTHHLPILAAELERIFRISEQYHRALQATEQLIIRRVLKYGDDEPMEFFLTEMVKEATDYNQAKTQRLANFFSQDYQRLMDRV